MKFTYPLGEFSPDAGWISNQGIGYLHNFIPVDGGYKPGPAVRPFFNGYFTGLTGEILGGISVVSESRYPQYYVAEYGITPGYNVFKYSSDGTPTDCTDSLGSWTVTGWASADMDKWGVQFAVYGKYLYMTDGNSGSIGSSLHYVDYNTTNDFVQASPATGCAAIKPKVIAAHNGHLLAANIKLGANWGSWTTSDTLGNLIWWSGFDQPENFGSVLVTPEIKGTDWKILYDTPGDITQIVPAGDVVFVFKDKAIYVGDGPPYRWSLLTNNIGCQFPNSIRYYSGKVYFMSDAGPSYIEGTGNIVNILTGKAQRSLIGTGSLFTV